MKSEYLAVNCRQMLINFANTLKNFHILDFKAIFGMNWS